MYIRIVPSPNPMTAIETGPTNSFRPAVTANVLVGPMRSGPMIAPNVDAHTIMLIADARRSSVRMSPAA